MSVIGSDLELDNLGARLRGLAANLMRVARGAGQPQDIVEQLQTALLAYSRFVDAHGHGPTSDQLHAILDVATENRWRDSPDAQHRMVSAAYDRLVLGGLQTAASRLMREKTREAAGERELSEGMAILREARARAV